MHYKCFKTKVLQKIFQTKWENNFHTMNTETSLFVRKIGIVNDYSIGKIRNGQRNLVGKCSCKQHMKGKTRLEATSQAKLKRLVVRVEEWKRGKTDLESRPVRYSASTYLESSSSAIAELVGIGWDLGCSNRVCLKVLI
jgi:hypothetical protein